MSEPFIRSAGPSQGSPTPGFVVDDGDVTFLTASILVSGDERNLFERYLASSRSLTIDVLEISVCIAVTFSDTARQSVDSHLPPKSYWILRVLS